MLHNDAPLMLYCYDDFECVCEREMLLSYKWPNITANCGDMKALPLSPHPLPYYQSKKQSVSELAENIPWLFILIN